MMARIGLAGSSGRPICTTCCAHALVAFGGYFLFGGWRLFAARDGGAVDAGGRPRADGAFEPRHWLTLAVIAALILSVLVLRRQRRHGAFVGAVLLVLLGAADDGEAIKRMPWGVIMMVIRRDGADRAAREGAGHRSASCSLVAQSRRRDTVTGVVAFLTGLVSVYSSTSGVVLPAFLPIVPGLAQQLGGANAAGDRHVDERRRPPRGRLAALDDRRAVHRRRSPATTAAGSSTSCWPGGCRWPSSARCSAIWSSAAAGCSDIVVVTRAPSFGGHSFARLKPSRYGVRANVHLDPRHEVHRGGLDGGGDLRARRFSFSSSRDRRVMSASSGNPQSSAIRSIGPSDAMPTIRAAR